MTSIHPLISDAIAASLAVERDEKVVAVVTAWIDALDAGPDIDYYSDSEPMSFDWLARIAVAELFPDLA